jgi:phage repressor protein C with HTH and peptisase S24 domain
MDLEWLRSQLDRPGYSQAELARRLGLAPSGVSKILKGGRRIIAHEADIIRAYLGAPPAGAVPGSGEPGDEPSATAAGLPHSPVTRVQPAPGRPDIPLWASAAAGDDGAIVLVPDPIDYLRRSERMLNVRSPFAFNVLGASMSPAIEHGDQVIINPSIVARPGHDCVFIHEGPDGMLALVKRLVRPGSDHYRVRQFNEPKDFDISRRKWTRVHPIAEIRKAGVG